MDQRSIPFALDQSASYDCGFPTRFVFPKTWRGESCVCMSDHCCHGIFYFFESLAIFVQNCVFLNLFAVPSENVFPNLWSLVFSTWWRDRVHSNRRGHSFLNPGEAEPSFLSAELHGSVFCF